MTTAIFVLKRRIISKKNSRRWIISRGRRFLVPSVAYRKMEADLKPELMEQNNKYKQFKFSKSATIRIQFYLKGKLDSDLDNIVSSILDLLQNSGIIKDDKIVMKIEAEKFLGASNFHTKIVLKGE